MMTTNGHRSSHDIERDVERTRAHMAETLDELRARMSPGQILDEVLGYAKETGGGRMMQNLGRTLQDNPAPLLVIGAGIAWMMASTRTGGSAYPYHARDERHRGRESRRGDGPNGEFGTGASDWTGKGGPDWSVGSAAESVRRTGEQVSDTMSAAAGSAAETARDFRDTAAETAADLRDAAQRGVHDMRDAAYRTGDAAYRGTRDFASSASDMLRDQPFVFGALGLALGAALGAALPESELEDELMGETSDAVKERATEAAAAGYEKAKSVVEKTWDRASEEAAAQGLTAEKADEAVGEVSEKVSAVWEATKESVREEASRQGLTEGSGADDAKHTGPAPEPGRRSID